MGPSPSPSPGLLHAHAWGGGRFADPRRTFDFPPTLGPANAAMRPRTGPSHPPRDSTHSTKLHRHTPDARARAPKPHARTPKATKPHARTPKATKPHARTPKATKPHARTPKATKPHARTPKATEPHARIAGHDEAGGRARRGDAAAKPPPAPSGRGGPGRGRRLSPPPGATCVSPPREPPSAQPRRMWRWRRLEVRRRRWPGLPTPPGRLSQEGAPTVRSRWARRPGRGAGPPQQHLRMRCAPAGRAAPTAQREACAGLARGQQAQGTSWEARLAAGSLGGSWCRRGAVATPWGWGVAGLAWATAARTRRDGEALRRCHAALPDGPDAS